MLSTVIIVFFLISYESNTFQFYDNITLFRFGNTDNILALFEMSKNRLNVSIVNTTLHKPCNLSNLIFLKHYLLELKERPAALVKKDDLIKYILLVCK